MDIIERIDELIIEAQKEPSWTAIQALRCLRKELLREQFTKTELDSAGQYADQPVLQSAT